jgi:hypothetical protein
MDNPAIVIPYGVAAGIGTALYALGQWLAKRFDRGDAAKDQTIALLTAENGRLRNERDTLGVRLDKANRDLLQAAGVTARIREDPNVDDAFAEDMPTGVRDMADLVASKKNSAPPPAQPARPPLHGAGGRQDYEDHRQRNAQEGFDTPTAYRPRQTTQRDIKKGPP